MPSQPEMHKAESTQQTRSASPETEAEGDERLTHPLSESEQRTRGNNESTQAEPEASRKRSGSSVGRRVLMVLALLAGLIFVADIETDIGDRLTGIVFPATVGISSPASTAASGTEKN